MSDLLTCPRMYQLKKEEGLQAPPEERGIALGYGSLWHAIMETGGDVEAAAAMCQWQDDPNDYRTLAKAGKAHGLWKQRYSALPWKLEEPETRFVTKVREDLEEQTGRYDGIVWTCEENVSDEVERWLVDYKTTSKMSGNWITEYRISNQFKFYYLHRSHTSPDTFAGVVVDVYCATPGNKKGRDEYEVSGNRFFRAFIRYSENDMDEAIRDYESALQTRDRYRAAGYFPKNTSMCWRCPFTDICETRDPALREALKEAYRG